MKTYWGWGIAPRILELGTIEGGEWSASRPDLFTPGERARPIGWEAGWTPEPVSTQCRREKFPPPAGNRTPDPRSSSL
jgi:hypothetical protein